MAGLAAYFEHNTTEGDSVIIDQAGNAGNPDEHARAFLVPTAGDKLGLQTLSEVTHLWVDKGAGWEWRAAVDQGVDFAGGKLGLQITASTPRGDDFGGGDRIEPFIPQEYRRPSARRLR